MRADFIFQNEKNFYFLPPDDLDRREVTRLRFKISFFARAKFALGLTQSEMTENIQK